jgi:YVTN family beta-propeller protein
VKNRQRWFALIWLHVAPLVALVAVAGAARAATVGAGDHPVAVAVNSVTNKVYIANQASNNVTVIDGATNRTFTLAAGIRPSAVAVNEAINKIYVANQGANNVTVIDGATNATAMVITGSSPSAVAVNPTTNKIYVANQGANNVTVIEGATNVPAFVDAGSQPVAVAVNPVTNKIYVANQASNDVTVIDGATNKTSTVAAGSSPKFLAVNPVTNKIYVANQGGFPTGSPGTHGSIPPLTKGGVTVIDGATGVTATLAVGPAVPVPLLGLLTIAVNPVTNRIYVADEYDHDVAVIDGATNAVTTVPTGDATLPSQLAVPTSANKVYVANQGGPQAAGSLTVIDGATNAITVVGAGTHPAAVAANAFTNTIYVANADSSDVSVIDGTHLVPLPTTGGASVILAAGIGAVLVLGGLAMTVKGPAPRVLTWGLVSWLVVLLAPLLWFALVRRAPLILLGIPPVSLVLGTIAANRAWRRTLPWTVGGGAAFEALLIPTVLTAPVVYGRYNVPASAVLIVLMIISAAVLSACFGLGTAVGVLVRRRPRPGA